MYSSCCFPPQTAIDLLVLGPPLISLTLVLVLDLLLPTDQLHCRALPVPNECFLWFCVHHQGTYPLVLQIVPGIAIHSAVVIPRTTELEPFHTSTHPHCRQRLIRIFLDPRCRSVIKLRPKSQLSLPAQLRHSSCEIQPHFRSPVCFPTFCARALVIVNYSTL